ncbi:MAG: hypothetical protein R3E14_03670 [Erythrobacter sp.]
MRRIQLSIEVDRCGRDGLLELDVLDEATALLVADINVRSGSAEMWDGDRRLARLTKHGGAHATFWQLG